MNINNCEISVLVNGRPITEYFHRGQTFVEGRGGSNYEIEFRNYNPYRVEAILSVDGLSVTDGKAAGPDSSGYVVENYGSLRVPGWTLNTEQVAAFAFSDMRGGSYVEQSTGSGANKGVIGALVYKEKIVRVAKSGPHMRGYYPQGNLNVSGSGYYPQGNMTVSGSITQQVFNLDHLPVEQSLGTAFGHATEFQTKTVSFSRGDMAAMIVLYYDSLEGLRKRGIVIPRREDRPQPQAFPGMTGGCVPPVGWDGIIPRQ